MKKHLLAGLVLIPLLLVGCFDKNEAAPPVSKPTTSQKQTTEQHLIYLDKSKDWLGEYEVNGMATEDGKQYSSQATGHLTLTYTNKDLSPTDKVSYTVESIRSSVQVDHTNMPANGLLTVRMEDEDAVFLKNNPQFQIQVTVTLHGKTEKISLSLKSS